MDAPFYVEEHRTVGTYGAVRTEYAIHRTGDGPLVRGNDVVLLHKIVDLLNDEINGRDVHR